MLLIFGYSFLKGTNLLDKNREFYVKYDNVEGLAQAGVHEFAFVGGGLKLRGADAAPLRPLAFPLTAGAPRP